MQPADFSWKRLRDAYTDPALLAQWLTESAAGDATSYAAVGAAVSARVRGGGALSGEILSFTGRETLLSWPELQGTLELKAFEMGPGNRVAGLRVSSWSPHPPS